jgi:hypothetical protein
VALQRLLRLPVEAALVAPLGGAATAFAFWAGAASGASWLGPALVLALDATLLLPLGPWRRIPGPSLRGAVPAALALLALLACTQYRGNRLDDEGRFRLDPFVAADTAFHVGLTRELTLGASPQVPGVSGFPLGYHLGTDLVRAAALSWARVDPYDGIARLDVTLWALALLLSVRSAAERLGGSPLAVDLAGFSLLATDLSFLLAGNPQAHWWCDLLRGNLLISLALANPLVPALTLALGALLALDRGLRGEPRALLLAAACGLALPFFKVFLGAHLLLGLGVAFLLHRPARASILAVAVPCALATAALVLGQGGQTVDVTLAPLDLVQVTAEQLGQPPLAGLSLLVAAAAWLLASLGLRAVAIPTALRALRQGVLPAALAVIALSAWPLGLLFRVSAPEVLEGQKFVNDAAYLVEQGGPLLWLFAAVALPGLLPRRAVLLAVATALALPSTLQFAVEKALLEGDPVPAAMVRAMRSLEQASQPGDVVLQRPGARYPPLPVVLIGRRVAYERFTPYLTQFARRSDLERRHEQVYRFFRTTDAAEARQIAADLHARFVCLYGADRVRFETAGWWTPVHQEPGAACHSLGAEPAR